MKRRTKNAEKRARKKAAKESSMLRSGHKSRYARKREWLARNQKFGFEVPEPKPWK